MKAMVYEKYGPPEVLHPADVAAPVPGRHDLVVRVRATTVSKADIRCRGFDVPHSFWIPARLKLGIFGPRRTILGGEFAGDVAEVGADVVRFKPGDAVFGETLMRPGAYAEYTCVADDSIVARKPTTMTYDEAAAVPIGARAALHYLTRAHVSRGQRVLVYGASGSVGTFAVQLATYFGAHVTAVCGGTHLALVSSLGADTAIDYTKEEFVRGGTMYDIVFVAVNACPFADCMRVLKADGTYLNVAEPMRSWPMWWATLAKGRRIVTGEMASPNADGLALLKDVIEQGHVRAVIDRRYTLDEIVDAHRYVEQGHKTGNVVVTVP